MVQRLHSWCSGLEVRALSLDLSAIAVTRAAPFLSKPPALQQNVASHRCWPDKYVAIGRGSIRRGI